jgi:plasmid stability protein
MIKTTLRLPDRLVEALRERSRQEGRSLNDVAVEALRRGLGEDTEEDETIAALRDIIDIPAAKRFDAEEHRRRSADVPRVAELLHDALEWTREER